MNHTKNAIIDAFWLLLEEKPYNKITVNDIVGRCQISRNTFYYHFQNIPELLETAVKNDADHMILVYGRMEAPLACITYFIDHCSKRKKAILHIYHSVFREYFINELDRIVLYTVTRYIEAIHSDCPISPEDKSLLIRFYKCLAIGILIDWLDAGMQYDMSYCTTRIGTLFSGAAEQAYQRAIESAQSSKG